MFRFHRSLFVGCLIAAAVVALSPVGFTPLAFTTHAFAQAAAATAPTVDVGGIFSDVRPTLEVILSVAVAGVCGLLAWGLKRLTGVTINAKLTGLLHDTLERGVHAGLDDIARMTAGKTIDVRSAVLAKAIEYVRTYRPDVVAHFKLDDAKLADLARVYLNKLMPAGVTV